MDIDNLTSLDKLSEDNFDITNNDLVQVCNLINILVDELDNKIDNSKSYEFTEREMKS